MIFRIIIRIRIHNNKSVHVIYASSNQCLPSNIDIDSNIDTIMDDIMKVVTLHVISNDLWRRYRT